jgi:hypothetical protein
VEADPHGKDAHQPGAKLDAGKPECALLLDFGLALLEVSKVSTYGANKYSRGGWQAVEDARHRYTGAMIRHLIRARYEPMDDETGISHIAHMTWNALALLELSIRNAKPQSK